MYSATQKTLDTEQKLRQQLEKDLETQKSIRQEKEVIFFFFLSACYTHAQYKVVLKATEGFPLNMYLQ